MKLIDIIKDDTLENIRESDKGGVPSWFRQDKHSPEDIESKLKGYRDALAQYKAANNSPMVTKMTQRIKEFEAKQKESNTARTQAH